MAYDTVDRELMGVGVLNLLGNAISALAAALERVVARWGCLERSAVLTSLKVVLEKRLEFGGIQAIEETGSRGLSLDAILGEGRI